MNLVRVPATEAAALLDAPPADLVVLDVRTPEEFAEGHLEGAELLDFYRADFADQLAALDRGVPYLLYCRSGNRSGQALEMMRQLGFEDVTEVEGGVISWSQEGLPLVTG
jgi:rhodanese-related sulfurtransferase